MHVLLQVLQLYYLLLSQNKIDMLSNFTVSFLNVCIVIQSIPCALSEWNNPQKDDNS